MNKTNWTPKQKEAIDTRNKNILVSAAAGSGKTAVLTQRIIDLIIQEKIDITSMLVLTFTNAAANEMKSRIQKKIYEHLQTNKNDKHVKNQISLVPVSSISTMHSFCIGIIRENFNILEIDPNFVIGNQSTISMLKDESIQELFEELYDQDDEQFLKTVEIFTNRYDDSKLIDLIYKIHNYILSKKEPIEWLYEQAEKYNINTVDNNEYFEELQNEILSNLEDLIEKSINLKELSKDIAYYDNIVGDIELFEDLKKVLLNQGYDSFVDEIKEVSLSRLKTKKKTDDEKTVEIVKDIRTNVIKKILTDSLKTNTIKSETYIKYMNQFYPIVYYLCSIVEKFDTRYRQKKLEKNIFDFNDLEHLTLKLLKNEDIRNKIKSKFKYIFYDEYQDSNEVHDSIIGSISDKNNLFFVGDVKQSIYGFRLADPSIFLEKYESYKVKDESLKIDLSSNFRSSNQILDFCNQIFEKIMIPSTSNMNYDDDAKLRTFREDSYNKSNIQINFINKKDDQSEDESIADTQYLKDDEIIARCTAKQICEMMEKDSNLKFKDFVVLKRSFSNGTTAYQKAFKDFNIPVFIDYQSSTFEVLEVSLFIDLLKIIDNLRQDIPLLSVLLSNIGGFSIDDITLIKTYDLEEKYFHKIFLKYSKDEILGNTNLGQKVKKFLYKISEYTKLQRYMRLDEFIDFVMIDSKYKDYVLSLNAGEMRFQNLNIVSEKAKEFMQNENKNLFSFLIYIDAILKNKADKIEPEKVSENQNVVRIMSIHKSKGLEFPIVIINDIQKKFNFQDLRKELILDSKLGIGVDYIDAENNFYMTTLAKKCIINKAKKNILAEEIRILYVALTRAKSTLILNGFANRSLEKIIKFAGTDLFPKNLNSIDNFQDFIMYSLLEKISDFNGLEIDINYPVEDLDSKICEFNYINPDTYAVLTDKTDIQEKFYELLATVSISNEEIQSLDDKYNFDYQYKDDIEKEIKISVTSVSKEKRKFKIEKLISYSDYVNKSNFSAEKIGTLNHLFLQQIDFTKSYSIQDLQDKLQSLVDLEFISVEESTVINLYNIYNFLNSEFGNRIKNSNKIFQEESFLMNYQDSILSGVVDLFFEEQDYFVLVDYKTDNILESEMKNRTRNYKNQIELYKDAIEKAFLKEVKQAYIYYLSLGKYIEVE